MNVTCPSCGAPIAFRAGASVVVVCASCRYAVLRAGLDASSLRLVGKVAELALTDTTLAIGMHGTFRDRTFTILGRLQLDFGAGVWDEFYAVFRDRSGIEGWGWLAVAQGQFLVTFPSAAPAIAYDAITVQMPIDVGGARFFVAEHGVGHVVAAEGELPTAIEIGLNFGYVDLSGEHGTFATLDYGHGNRATPEIAYVGWKVEHDALGLPAPSTGAATGAAARSAEGTKLACPKCGAPIDVRGGQETKRIVCGHCNSLLDATAANAGALAWLAVLDQLATVPKIPIGSEGRLDLILKEALPTGAPPPRWRLIGFMTRQCRVDGTLYFWDEYLLYEPSRGFRYLMEQQGHWSIITPLDLAAVLSNAGDAEAYFRGDTFKKFSRVTATVARVLGEFHWQVQLGEATDATDFVLPKKGLTLSRELEGAHDRQEVHWSLGHYVNGRALFDAFGVKAAPPNTIGVGPNQPSQPAKTATSIALLSVVLLVAWFVMLVVVSARADDALVFTKTLKLPLESAEPAEASPTPSSADSEPASEPAFFSEPFEISASGVAEAQLTTVLNNSYLWVGGAVIDEESGEVHEFQLEASSYRGVEDGESWQEGSPTASTTIGSLPKGRYVVRLQPQTDATPGHATAFDLKIRAGTAVLWPGIFAFLFIVVPPLLAALRAFMFEARRWSESTVRSAYKVAVNDSSGGSDD